MPCMKILTLPNIPFATTLKNYIKAFVADIPLEEMPFCWEITTFLHVQLWVIVLKFLKRATEEHHYCQSFLSKFELSNALVLKEIMCGQSESQSSLEVLWTENKLLVIRDLAVNSVCLPIIWSNLTGHHPQCSLPDLRLIFSVMCIFNSRIRSHALAFHCPGTLYCIISAKVIVTKSL